MMKAIRVFEDFFRSDESARDKFLSRLFGIFNEEIVRIWCRSPQSRYRDLGRPRLKKPEDKGGYTLDFALQPKDAKKVLVAEMKCWLEYQNYRYLKLESCRQLETIKNDAFLCFRELALDPTSFIVEIGGKRASPDGCVLVWGSVTEEGRSSVMSAFGLYDVLSLERIVEDLLSWKDREFQDFVERRRSWCDELFGYLAGRGKHHRCDDASKEGSAEPRTHPDG